MYIFGDAFNELSTVESYIHVVENEESPKPPKQTKIKEKQTNQTIRQKRTFF